MGGARVAKGPAAALQNRERQISFYGPLLGVTGTPLISIPLCVPTSGRRKKIPPSKKSMGKKRKSLGQWVKHVPEHALGRELERGATSKLQIIGILVELFAEWPAWAWPGLGLGRGTELALEQCFGRVVYLRHQAQ